MNQLCPVLRSILKAAMVIGIVIAVIGFVVAFVGILVAAIVVASSSTPVTVFALLSVPVFGKLIVIGLIGIAFGIVLFLCALALYVLVDFVCATFFASSAQTQAQSQARKDNVRVPDPKEVLELLDSTRCMIVPFLPAATLLLIAVPVALLLYLLLRNQGYDLSSPGVGTLIVCVVVILCVFGLLLSLVPLVWCCCKCRKTVGPSALLKPFLDALETTANAVQLGTSAASGLKNIADQAGLQLQNAAATIDDFAGETVLDNPTLAPLADYVFPKTNVTIGPEVNVINGQFSTHTITPTYHTYTNPANLPEIPVKTALHAAGNFLRSMPLDPRGIQDSVAKALRAAAAMLRSFA